MLRLLLNFWLFPIFGMFFAASATIGDVSGGGDDASSDTGGSDGSSGSDDGVGGDDGEGDGNGTGEDDASLDASDGSDAGDGVQTDPDAPVDLGDGRQVPGKWKKLFDAAAKAGLGKEAKQLYFAQQRLAKAIPGGVNAAIQLAKDVEELGGVEGVQSLQDNIATYQADEELFNSGDPRWVESGFKENPESALKLFAHTLDFVADHHQEHYDHLMAKVIVNDLGSLDVRGIHGILAAMKDNPEAARLAKQLAEYYNSRLETSKKAPEKKVDAQSKALDDRAATVKKQEMDVRYKQVNLQTGPALKSEVTKVLRAEAKASGIDIDKLSKEYPAEWRNMLNDIHRAIMDESAKDRRFIDKYAALVEKNELQRAAKAINDKHAAIAADIVRRVKATYGVFRGKKAAPGTDKNDKGGTGGGNNATAQNQGWTRVSARPQNSAINWRKTTSAMQLDGKYILNDGKKVVVQY